jgi:hypothetical protein
MITGLDDIVGLDNTPPTVLPIAIWAISARLVTAPLNITKLIVAAVVFAAACIELIRNGGASISVYVSSAGRASCMAWAVIYAPCTVFTVTVDLLDAVIYCVFAETCF